SLSESCSAALMRWRRSRSSRLACRPRSSENASSCSSDRIRECFLHFRPPPAEFRSVSNRKALRRVGDCETSNVEIVCDPVGEIGQRQRLTTTLLDGLPNFRTIVELEFFFVSEMSIPHHMHECIRHCPHELLQKLQRIPLPIDDPKRNEAAP